jgi:(1->4)-alpha-D-glucan 1-alpha-D-glucosylmutase
MPFSEAQCVPAATYRLQLRLEFPFAEAGAQIAYLRQLGMSHCYCSPILMSTPGSTHGYDVNDYRRIDPDLGGEEGFAQFAATVKAHGMRILLDFVPNHMGINGGRNPWWLDVLECGPHSPYAEFFDIDWRDLHDRQPRVLVPILDDQYGVVLEQGRFAIVYDGGEFELRYESMQFPLSPGTYASLLSGAVQRLSGDGEARQRLAALGDAFRDLPRCREGEPEKPIGQRERDRLKLRLAALTEANETLLMAVKAEIGCVNGLPDNPRSLDRLDSILNEQHYRLAHWKTGVHEANYRRFFAIDSLIGLRMENPRVFEEAHRLVGMLIRRDLIHGLRIDHIDGLRNPLEYLERLQTLALKDGTTTALPFYVVIEKILEDGEELDSAWPAHGTTGYEFIRQLTEIFVNPAAEPKFTRLYARFTGETEPFADVVHAEKRLVLDEMFANAVTHLGHQLADLVNADRRWCNLTRHELTVAIREIMAGLGVYRIYRRLNAECRHEDAREVEHACAEALRRNPRRDPQPFTFVRDVLIGRYPPPSATIAYRESLWRWVLTWQQYTGAVMAKSVEDTAFYVYNRFIALNEVGGNPGMFGGAIANFHLANRRRQAAMAHTLLATSTHDTKFGEDARARLYVLSEIPDEWADWVEEWSTLNRRHKVAIAGRLAPDASEEYRFYQTLLSCWPMESFEPDEKFRARLREHLGKAVNEARRNTHWLVPNEPWIQALGRFVDILLTPATGHDFLASFAPRAQRLAHLGMVNSLAQVVLKTTSPGVPDFYQGCELWNLSLVDPDNRQLVDWTSRAEFAAAVAEMPWRELLRHWQDGGVKLRLTQELLRFRNAQIALFQRGDYEPVELQGRFADRLVAFRRRLGDAMLVVVVPRLTSSLGCPPLGLVWEDTFLPLPSGGGCWREILTQREFSGANVEIAELFSELPLAVLWAHSDRDP